MAKQGRKRKGNFQKGASLNKAPYRKDDVFEADDSDPEEEKNVGDRYDRVDNYEYELPSDFEDEEIDEDAAFNSEDERMYGHLFAGRGGSGGDSEGEEESGSEGDDGLLDSDEDGESGGGSDEEEEDYDSELEEAFARGGGGGSDDEEEEGDEEGEEGGEEEEDEMARRAMVEALTGTARKGAKERRRRRDVVVTEAYPESEFNLPAAGPEGELTLTDLIAGLGDGRAKLGAARKALERLEKRAAPVAAPLPGPIRERQERKAGYESAKKDIAKWMPVVKAHREAPTLHFKADAAAVPRTVTTASIAAKHTPETAMEAEVVALLTAAGAQTAAAVAEAEEALAMKELTVAEASARREKLAKMRALLFYHEKKAKRMKKIKSKEYRRRMKKAEARKAAAGAGGGDGDDELALDEDELRRQLEEAEFDRAQERLTLKHRNTSRFIRRALKRGGPGLDDGTKEAVAEQLRLGQELRQRVHRMGGGRGSGSDDSGTDASDDESSDEGGEGAGRGELSAKAKAAALEILQGGGGAGGEEAPTEGLFALPFMQRAMARRKAAAAEEAQALLDMDGGGSGAAEDSGRGGRMKFGGSGEAQRLAERVRAMEAAAADDSDLEGDEREDAEAKAERLAKRLRVVEEEDEAAAGDGGVLGRVTRQQAKISKQDRLFEPGGGGSGGLDTSKPLGSGGISRGGVQVSVGPSSRAAAAAGAGQDEPPPAFIRSTAFQGAKAGYAFKKGPKGVGYYADKKAAGSGKATAAAPAAQRQQQQAPKPSKKRQQREESSDGDEEQHMRPAGANGTAANGTPSAKKGNAGLDLSQEELVRRAFAGDDVVANFAAEKAAEVEAELPTADVPGALPGWGTWAGAKREPRWAVEAKAKAAAAREAAAAARADAGLQYVVITEKWDRRNAKYRTPQVPYPYDSKETYERAMRQPLGRQFNTDAGFRNLTRPAVVKDAGVVIQPVRYSAAMAQHAREDGGGRRHAVLTVEGGMPKRARLDKNRGGQKGKKRVGSGGD